MLAVSRSFPSGENMTDVDLVLVAQELAHSSRAPIPRNDDAFGVTSPEGGLVGAEAKRPVAQAPPVRSTCERPARAIVTEPSLCPRATLFVRADTARLSVGFTATIGPLGPKAVAVTGPRTRIDSSTPSPADLAHRAAPRASPTSTRLPSALSDKDVIDD